jgi:hypothetical protein
MPYPAAKPREVSAWIGDGLPQPVPLRNLVAQLTRRWDTYYILPSETSCAGDRQVPGTWRKLLGQNVLELDDLDAARADGRGRHGTGRSRQPPHRRPRLPKRERAAVNRHVIVVGLGYGDAGKGTIVDWLCRAGQPGGQPGGQPDGAPPAAVIRFNGGAQAAHHVVAPSGQVHAFAQFGSGTLAGTPTFLSRFTLVDPLALTAEAEHLRRLGVSDPFGLLTVDREALLTTPCHRAANQAREAARGSGRHGSCGMGVGETARYALEYPPDAPRAGDLTAPATLRRKLALLRDRLPGPAAALRVRRRPGRPAGRVARVSPLHDLRQRGDAAGRLGCQGGGQLRAGRGYRVGPRTVTRLEPGPAQDLDYQQTLTDPLLAARPVYDPGSGPAPEDWPDVVAEILHAPVTVRSYGPAAGDKTALNRVGTRPLDALSR